MNALETGTLRSVKAPKPVWLVCAVVVSLVIGLAAAGSAPAKAKKAPAKPVAIKVTNCDGAIGALNSALVEIAKKRVALRNAGTPAKRKAGKRALKKSRTRGNAARAAIRTHCFGGAIRAESAACSQAITVYSVALSSLYERKLALKRVRTKGGKLIKKRTRKTKLKKLAQDVKTTQEMFTKACAGNGNSDNGGNGSGSGSGDNGGRDGGSGGQTPVAPSAPGAVTIDVPSGPVNTNTPTITITTGDNGGYVECSIDGGPFVIVPEIWTLPALADGTHTITCHYVGWDGEIGPDTTVTITIDTTPPAAPTITGPSGITNDPNPAYALSTDETGDHHFECAIDGAGYTVVESPFTAVALADGNHTISCHVVDAAGNVGADASVSLTVDTTAPGGTTITGPGGVTNDPNPTYTLEEQNGENTGFECKVDDGAYQTANSTYTVNALSDGTHTITCRAIDDAGNAGDETSVTVTIDTTAPGATSISGPTGATNDNTPTYTLGGAGSGEHYECRVDGGAYAPVTSPYTTSALSDGSHTISCHITDGAGNTGPDATASVTVDTVAPGGVTMTGPSGAISNNKPSYTITGGGSGVTYQCMIDGGAYAGVASPYTTPALADGPHTISCRAVDAAGNAGASSSKSVTVDTIVPGSVTISGPTGLTNDNTPTYNLGGVESGGHYECKVDGGSYAIVTSPYTTSALSDGTHTISCRSVDAAGNAGAASSVTVTIDTVAPGSVTMSGPSGATNDNTPTYNLGGVESGGHYECKVDGGAYAPVTSPYTTSALSDGSHTISCRGVDAAGNAGAATSKTVSVDTVAPGAPTMTGPSGLTNDSTPTYTLGGVESGGTYECKIDNGAYAPATSPYTTVALVDGAHTISCRSVDAAGNVGPGASKTITVDTVAPGAITITGPTGTIKNNKPSYTLSGAESGGRYECKVDSGSYATVGSPYTTATLSDGTHTISCRGVDAAGNAGSSSAVTVTVDTVGPTTTIASLSTITDTTPSFALTASEVGATFQCKVDAGSYQSTGATFTTAVLSTGTHTVSCRATDLAGNTGAETSKSISIVAGTPFNNPTTVTGSGSLGLACTASQFINNVLGCTAYQLTITIPAYPNGMTGNYLADVSATVQKLSSLFGVFPTYSMYVQVDGATVASDSEKEFLDILGLCGANLTAAKTNLSLSASVAHKVTVSLKASALLAALPRASNASLTVKLH